MDIKHLKTFLDSAHSVYHAVAGLVWELEAAGYTCLSETQNWYLSPGGKYYMTRGGSALVAFRIPETRPNGFLLSAVHSDRPCFKLKPNGEQTGKYTRLLVEKYGGMLMASWLDRPLSVAGRVMVGTPEGVESRLVDIDRDLLLIPNVAVHMNREANNGYKWNPAVDLLPLLGGADAAGKLQSLLEAEAGGEILGQDLYLYLRQNATVWGVDGEYLSAAALDDLLCAWCCMQGFLAAEDTASVPVLCVFDHEETGSQSVQGADSDLLSGVLNRICASMNWERYPMLSQSFMVSADNAHGLHPNHPEYADEKNAPLLGEGVVVKHSASGSYMTDALGEAVIRSVCQKAGVPVQTYCNRADLPGGSTLGHVSVSQVSVPTADIGLAQLAMHSCYETAGVADIAHLVRAMTAYYSTELDFPEDGICHIM